MASSDYAYREDKSPDTVLHHLVNNWISKSMLFRSLPDVERIFDNTSNLTIRKAIDMVPKTLADWTQNMLMDKFMTIEHDDIILRGHLTKVCLQ